MGLLLLVLLLLMLGGGFYGHRRGYYGRAPFGIGGAVLVVIFVCLLFGGMRFY